MNYRMFQRTIFLALFFFTAFFAGAQVEVQYEIEGKTFYDAGQSKVKEAYEYKLRYNGSMNPRTGQVVMDPTPMEVKNGLYILYREDGTIECTGYFKNGTKCGEWKHMDVKGNVLRKETVPGDCVEAQ